MWLPPAVTDTAFGRLKASTGMFEDELLPSPSWPSELLPQHMTLPVARTAQVW